MRKVWRLLRLEILFKNDYGLDALLKTKYLKKWAWNIPHSWRWLQKSDCMTLGKLKNDMLSHKRKTNSLFSICVLHSVCSLHSILTEKITWKGYKIWQKQKNCETTWSAVWIWCRRKPFPLIDEKGFQKTDQKWKKSRIFND